MNGRNINLAEVLIFRAEFRACSQMGIELLFLLLALILLLNSTSAKIDFLCCRFKFWMRN